MTAAYHAFPETAPGPDGRKPEAEGDEEISTEAAAMAYLMRGIHF
jgi:hypothetical protein